MPESKSAVDGRIKRPSFISDLLVLICCLEVNTVYFKFVILVNKL